VAASCAAAVAQTDIAFSALGSFSQSSSGNGTIQTPSIQMGGLFQLRHIWNPLVGFEITYSYNRANQAYISSPTSQVLLPPQSVPSNAHEITGDWVLSLKLLNFRPFVLAGIGGLIDVPKTKQSFTYTSSKVVYLYGGGLDVGLIPHFGLRLQYRGNINKAPDLSTIYASTDTYIHTGQPMAGIYIRF
jgi:hypothetical protein